MKMIKGSDDLWEIYMPYPKHRHCSGEHDMIVDIYSTCMGRRVVSSDPSPNILCDALRSETNRHYSGPSNIDSDQVTSFHKGPTLPAWLTLTSAVAKTALIVQYLRNQCRLQTAFPLLLGAELSRPCMKPQPHQVKAENLASRVLVSASYFFCLSGPKFISLGAVA
jgi:hypothetical protein